MSYAAQLADVWDIPISGYWSADNDLLVDRAKRFPTLSRVTMSISHHGERE